MEAFRRYTNLADLIYTLREKRISLRNPQHWDDKNDSYYLERYRTYRGLNTLFALCFADEKGETYHHWRVFSGGANGVSIRFEKEPLLTAFRNQCKFDGVTPLDHRVNYRKIEQLQRDPPCVEDLPFLKWSPYGDESEYRIVYASENSRESWGFPINVAWIQHISLSPWLPPALERSVRNELTSIDGCSRLCVSKSRVIDFDAWKKIADQAGSFDPIQLAGTWPGEEPLDTLLKAVD